RLAIRLGLRWEAERADHRIEPRAHRRVADPELALHILEVAACLDERLEKIELVRGEVVKPPERERAFDTSAAGRALEARNAQRVRADGASRDHWIRHALKVRVGLIECQAKLSD